MLFKTFIAIAALLGMLALWLGIQAMARRTSEQHPEFGPFREAGGGCGGGKGGCGSACAGGNNGSEAYCTKR